MLSALLVNGVPIECINHAAIAYHVPATLITSILLTEGGKVGSATPNKNGSYDYGPMQINTIWLNKLHEFGITQDDIQYNPCINVWVGTWILSQRIADATNLSYGVGSYNSYSPPQNYRYRTKVSGVYNNLNYLLSIPNDKFKQGLQAAKQKKQSATNIYSQPQ